MRFKNLHEMEKYISTLSSGGTGFGSLDNADLLEHKQDQSAHSVPGQIDLAITTHTAQKNPHGTAFSDLSGAPDLLVNKGRNIKINATGTGIEAGEVSGNATSIALIPVDISGIADGYMLMYDERRGVLHFAPPPTTRPVVSLVYKGYEISGFSSNFKIGPRRFVGRQDAYDIQSNWGSLSSAPDTGVHGSIVLDARFELNDVMIQ